MKVDQIIVSRSLSNGGKDAIELSQGVKHYFLPLEVVIGRGQRNAFYRKAGDR